MRPLVNSTALLLYKARCICWQPQGSKHEARQKGGVSVERVAGESHRSRSHGRHSRSRGRRQSCDAQTLSISKLYGISHLWQCM